jgi:uncharacterized membrane protein YhaH (DUF805 family)
MSSSSIEENVNRCFFFSSCIIIYFSSVAVRRILKSRKQNVCPFLLCLLPFISMTDEINASSFVGLTYQLSVTYHCEYSDLYVRYNDESRLFHT